MNKHYNIKMWGSGGAVPPFLALVLDGYEWSQSHPDKESHLLECYTMWLL
jgi:hypothetical protein